MQYQLLLTFFQQPTWRLWGEEREKDAIFTVYLKKVRYHRPTPSASSVSGYNFSLAASQVQLTICNFLQQDSDDEISHLEWETVRVRFIKAATLPRLVEALATDDGELESTFINVFMATYRTFTQPEKVLELLLARYERLHSEPLHTDSVSAEHKKSLVSALHVWLDGYPEDWEASNLQRLLTFTAKRLPNSEVHMKAALRLDRLTRTKNHQQIRSWSSQDGLDLTDQFGGLCLTPAFRVPQLHILHSYRFPHVPVKHFAEQLTRMDMVRSF